MQPAGRRARRGAERKPREQRWTQLVEVATQVFYEKGYEAASLQDIADRVGMLKGSLYYYIQSKEDLLFDVISTVHRDGLANIQVCAAINGDGLQRLENVIIGHVEHTCRTLVATTVFLHELAALPEERRQEVLGSEHAYQSVFRDLIAEGQREGVVRAELDARLAALSILGSTNWVYRWYRPGGRYSPQQIGRQLADMNVRAIATTEAVTAREQCPHPRGVGARRRAAIETGPRPRDADAGTSNSDGSAS